MTNIHKSHQDHTVIESNIRFYALEINFLLRIITREYSSMVNSEKIKLLDTFCNEFEKYGIMLVKLSEKIKKEERTIKEKYLNHPANTTKSSSHDEAIISEYSGIVDELKLLKQSLYDYLENGSSAEH